MNVEEAIQKVFAVELPEAVITVKNGVKIEADLPFFTSIAEEKQMYEIFVEICNQLAGGLAVDFDHYNLFDQADVVNRLIFTAEILPVEA